MSSELNIIIQSIISCVLSYGPCNQKFDILFKQACIQLLKNNF